MFLFFYSKNKMTLHIMRVRLRLRLNVGAVYRIHHTDSNHQCRVLTLVLFISL